MGRNLPPGVNVSDLPGNEPVKRGGVEDTRNYGDEAECAVCGKPLKRPPRHPEHPDFCDDHDEDDLREKEKRIAERAREREEMTPREKRMEEEFARQQDRNNER